MCHATFFVRTAFLQHFCDFFFFFWTVARQHEIDLFMMKDQNVVNGEVIYAFALQSLTTTSVSVGCAYLGLAISDQNKSILKSLPVHIFLILNFFYTFLLV